MTVSPDMLKAFTDDKLPSEEAHAVAADATLGEVAAAGQSWIPVCAMAAGLALGVLLAASFGLGADMRSSGGTLLAQGELAHVLSTALVSDERNLRPTVARVGTSFWSKNESFCRTFITQRVGQTVLAGIACRERGAWRIPVVAIDDSRESGETSIMGNLPAPVRSVMDNLIVGAPLDGAAERQARNQAWHPR